MREGPSSKGPSFFVLFVELSEKVAAQKRDIIQPVTQRRQVYVDDIKSEKQVLPEAAGIINKDPSSIAFLSLAVKSAALPLQAFSFITMRI